MRHNVKILTFERDNFTPVRVRYHRVTTIPGLYRLLCAPHGCYRAAEMLEDTAVSLGMRIEGNMAFSVHRDYIMGAAILESF